MAKEINLKEIFLVMKRRWWMIVGLMILAILGGYIFGEVFKTQPLYLSSSRLVIGGTNPDFSTFQVLIKDSTVLEEVSKEVQGTRSPVALASEITASDVDSSQILSISVIDQDPRMAAAIANVTATVFKDKAAEVLNYHNIKLLSGAKVDPTPVNSNSKHLKLFAALGLALGVGLVFFLNTLDDSIQSESELEKILGAPVLGRVSKMKKKNMMALKRTPDIRKNTVELTNMLHIESTEGKSIRKRKKPRSNELDLTNQNSTSL